MLCFALMCAGKQCILLDMYTVYTVGWNKQTNKQFFSLSNLVCMDIVEHFVLKENKLLYMYLTLVYYAEIMVNKGSKCTNNKTD